MDAKLIWYTARASGLVSWALLTASVIWGLSMTARPLGRHPRPAWTLDLHRFLAAAALAFLGIHVTSILLDTYVHFGLVEVLVPLTGSWHPGAVAWGIAGFYLLLALELTSLLRARLPGKLWRTTHFLAFPLFVMTTIHGLTAGTDRHNPMLQAAFYGASAVVAGLTVLRLSRRTRGSDLVVAGRAAGYDPGPLASTRARSAA